MSDRNDVLKVEVKVNEGALNLKRTENAVRLAKMNLCHYIGYPLDSEVDVAESSLPESGSVSGSTAISGRPEYQMLDKKVQAAAQQVRMTRADALPQAGIFAGYGYTHGLTVNDETFIDMAGFSVGAKVGIPIFHFSEHFYKVKSDKSKYEQAVSERDSSYELMTLEMSKAATSWMSLNMNVLWPQATPLPQRRMSVSAASITMPAPRPSPISLRPRPSGRWSTVTASRPTSTTSSPGSHTSKPRAKSVMSLLSDYE